MSQERLALRRFVNEFETQKDAAKALGVSPQYVNRLLKERERFSEAMLEKLGLKRIVVSK